LEVQAPEAVSELNAGVAHAESEKKAVWEKMPVGAEIVPQVTLMGDPFEVLAAQVLGYVCTPTIVPVVQVVPEYSMINGVVSVVGS